ncbi:SRP receptor beta subunit [Aspergillus sp. HF37]|nr:SRP receptor beta subunit [Aspergillus sp. HF37]
MSWHSSFKAIMTSLLEGSLFAIAITALIAFGLPVLLHFIFYRAVASPPRSNFLLLGPPGAGKTALLSLLEAKISPRSKTSQVTHTSQTSTLATISLPPSVPIASNQFRSVNDPSLKDISRNPVKYAIQDTPGHGKLRWAQGISQLQSMSQTKDPKSKVRGVIFMVDAASLSGDDALRDAATYLHDVLLILQKRALSRGRSASTAAAEIPVLVAANKQDLFTALPPNSVREKLAAEIDRIRRSKSKGLMDASADAGTGDAEDDILGNDDAPFSFKMLEDEVGVKVDVVGGAIKDGEGENLGSGVRKWEEWIGMCL